MSKRVFFAWILIATVSHAIAGPLHDAAKEGDIAKVMQLVASGEDINQNQRSLGTPLHQASMWGSKELAKLLIAHGANVNADNPILGTPLLRAARKGNEGVAAVIIAHGADVSARWKDGTTPLHAAAEGGHAGVVDLLVAHGADVNARSADTAVKKGFPGRAGYSALHAAGLNGHFDTTDLLRAYGARGPIVEPVTGLFASALSSEGEKIFDEFCSVCHSIEMGGFGRNGPNLWGVLGQEKAGIEGFAYSKAFTRLQGTWTLAEFNAFIASPVDYVPGKKMVFEGSRTRQHGPISSPSCAPKVTILHHFPSQCPQISRSQGSSAVVRILAMPPLFSMCSAAAVIVATTSAHGPSHQILGVRNWCVIGG